MKIRDFFILMAGVLSLSAPVVANAALPTCQSASSDLDGDGFGWENNASCRVASGSGSTEKPVCTDSLSDPDGDGFGWENNTSCVVEVSGAGGVSNGAIPSCSDASFDPDGDGYGWENNASCIVNTTTPTTPNTVERPICVGAASDPDGDGFGWENNTTCVVAETGGPAQPDYRPLSAAYPYRTNSPYAGTLKRCALVESIDDSCKLHELSFIGQVNSNPTVNDIMSRVIVTHDWMGRRFERLLNSAPDTMLRMFQSVAVIAIGSDVRPSSYSTLNGLIKIDPYFLWMSVDEKRTIDPGDDFRSNFGADLKFRRFTRFKKPDGSFLSYPSLTDNSQRTFSDLVEPAVSLLFHELAHAVDFAPAWTLADMSYEDSINSVIRANTSNWLSPQLQAIYPNQSALLDSLAGVRFFNDDASDFEKSITSVLVGAEFESDGAAMFYSYSTIREDFANLIEAALMKYHYDVSVGVYFYDKPSDIDPTCKIGWGVMNRIANPSVLPRAEWAVKRAVPVGSSIEAFFANGAGVEVSDRVGEDLCNRDTKALEFVAPRLY